MKKLILFGFSLFVLGTLSAQNSKTETPQKGTKQEPVKQGEKQSSKSETKSAPAAKSTDSTNGTQKMAITEQGISKNKNKKTTEAVSTPAPTEKKK